MSCLLLVVALIAGLLAFWLWLGNWVNGKFEIARFDCGSNRVIVITAANTWEVSQPIYYLVIVDGKTVVPTTCIGNHNPDDDPYAIEFLKVASADGNVVGISYADAPSKYLILHDFESQASFPRGEHIRWDDTLDSRENNEVRVRAWVELENRLNSSRIR